MIRKVLKISNKKIRNKSKLVPSNAKLTKLLQDMKDTMNSLGGVGIAAPQINVFFRVILIAPPEKKPFFMINPEKKQYSEKKPFFMINPEIKQYSEEKQTFQEACLSVPRRKEFVERSQWILIEYEDEKRIRKKAIAYDFEAQIIQHEIEHLDGILFTDHSN